jgi:hypothetical protein
VALVVVTVLAWKVLFTPSLRSDIRLFSASSVAFAGPGAVPDVSGLKFSAENGVGSAPAADGRRARAAIANRAVATVIRRPGSERCELESFMTSLLCWGSG